MVVHNEFEDFVEAVLCELGHLQTRLRRRGFGGNSLQFSNVESLVPFLEAQIFFPEPAPTGVLRKVFGMLRGDLTLDLHLL